MQIQTKLLSGPDKENQVLMVAQGVLNTRGLEHILREISAAAIRHLNCKVLIDLVDADCRIERKEIDGLFHEPRPDLWPKECKTALVSSLEHEQYRRLSVVSTTLVRHGFRIAVFRDAKAAVGWLTDGS